MPSPEIFYLHVQGEQRGPYTIPQIDHLLHSGLIAEETLYWREGLDQWQPVTSLVPLRRPRNPWLRRGIFLAVALALAAAGAFFGPIALIGWRETNQHQYTASAAYWRAREAVRTRALPPKALVQFGDFTTAAVELQPPRAATVRLRGEVTVRAGQHRASAWIVPLTFEENAREWSAGEVREVTP